MTSIAHLYARPAAADATENTPDQADLNRESLTFFLSTGDDISERLQQATACAFWQEAVRLGLKLGEMAAKWDDTGVGEAAHKFAHAAYHGGSIHDLRNGAQMVVFEYERLRLTLAAQYPELVA